MDIRQGIGFITGKPGKHPFPEHLRNSKKIAADGMVLLKNNKGLLPLKTRQVALFGAGAVDTVVCGTGSGYVMAPYVFTVLEGLEKAGFTVTSTEWLKRFKKESRQANKADKTISKLDRFWSGMSILIEEPEIRDEELSAALAADTAIYVVRRNAGENKDRRAVKGDYYLSDRERCNLEMIAGNFKHTVVILNTCVMDANFIEQTEGIDAAILMGQAGCEAGNALADLLTGKVSPCGHLTDTWAKRYEDNPASATFGSNDGNCLQEDYTEDIYVGYRYFDTFGVEPLYPFGFGLTYGIPEYELAEFRADWKQVNLKVQVKNVGRLPARFVVQVYVTAPLGEIDKPYQELKGYGKTEELAVGKSQSVDIMIPTEIMASYHTEKEAFVMEAGAYLFRIGDNSRDTKVMAILNLDRTVRVRQVSRQLSPDHELTVLTTPQDCADRVVRETKTAMEAGIRTISVRAEDCVVIDGAAGLVAKRMSGKGNSYATLIDVAEGRVSIEEFVDSLDEEVLYRLVAGAADEVKHSVPKRTAGKYKPVGGPASSGSTTSLYADSLGIPNWKVTDGPAGCHLPFCGVTGWPVGMVIAQTWDNRMSGLAGMGIGKELKAYKHSIILGPGMNIHRDPLGGRAFEYYSEDPLISGRMAAAMTIGVQKTPGTGVAIKHFATNNQEEGRLHENNTVSERALREIYLRGFEICVREAGPKTVMTSYNCLNGIHTSSSYELITNVLRGEWGFQGLVMTDWGSQSEKHLDLAAGNDLIMGGYRSDFLKSAVHGTPAEFGNDGYVRVQEFKVYGGFFKNVVEFWNAFKPDANGSDKIVAVVAPGVMLSDKVSEKVKEGIASVTENEDGSRTVTYRGYDRGKYLDIEDVKTCATRTLLQLIDSVSYRLMTGKGKGKGGTSE